jgi:A/G-specific adenine glycosylase
MEDALDDRKIGRFQKRLLAWYRESHRPLPWRETRDPYAIWISEILLQQTRVKTAIAYYERFLDRFPTLTHLADAPIDSVLHAWQGLGYYGRARNLHRAAGVLKQAFNGTIPCEPEELEKLPGIGPYTAAAIASIAFDRDAAVLDGNVTRVLCRLVGIHAPPKDPNTQKRLRRFADRLLPKGRAAVFNQAMMELGALVCKPSKPDCPACPVKAVCVACEEGTVERLPLRTSKPKLPVRVRVVAAIRYRGRLLFERRPLNGFLGGLWELPGSYLQGEEANAQGLRRIRKQVGSRMGPERVRARDDFSVKHLYSHFEESNRVFICEGMGGSNRGPWGKREPTYRWIHPTKLSPYPITGATRKILQKLDKKEAETTVPSPKEKRCSKH